MIFDIKYKRRFVGEDFNHTFRCDSYRSFEFGKNCYIGPYCHFDAMGGIRLEDFVIVGPHVRIWSYNHDFLSPEIPYGPDILKCPVVIGKGVWIGMQALILPGAQIGQGSVIGAGSIVKGAIPPFSLVRPHYATYEPLRVQKDEARYYRMGVG